MRISERDKARLAEIIAIVKPKNSVAARLDTLTNDQRECYDNWKARCDRFIQRYPDGDAFANYLDGYGPFSALREDIKVALFGNTPTIPDTANGDMAAQIYERYRNG